MYTPNPSLFAQYDPWIQAQLSKAVNSVLNTPEIRHIQQHVQQVLNRDVVSIMYTLLEHNFIRNNNRWKQDDAESLIIIAAQSLAYRVALEANIIINEYADSYAYLVTTLQALENLMQQQNQQWAPPVAPMQRPDIYYNQPNNQFSAPIYNAPVAPQYPNNIPPPPVPVWDNRSGSWVIPQYQNNLPPPPPVPIWDPVARQYVLPQPNMNPAYNTQVGSNFTQFQPPQSHFSQTSNNLQPSTISNLAMESVMQEKDHMPTGRVHDVNLNAYGAGTPVQQQTTNFNNFNNHNTNPVQEAAPEVKPPTKVYAKVGLIDSRKDSVIPIQEGELALGLYTLTDTLLEPTLIEINNIKRVMYDGSSFTTNTRKETRAELKTKLHEFTTVTSVLQIIKLVGELRDDFEAKYIADLICSRVKNCVELAMIHRYGDDSHKSLPYIEFYDIVGDLFIALNIKEDMDNCVVHMVANMFVTTDLIAYIKNSGEAAEVTAEDEEIINLANELKQPIQVPNNSGTNIDLLVLDIPVNTIVLPWVTSYTHSTNKLTVRVGEEVLYDLLHQAFSLLPAETLFIDLYDNMHKRYRVYRRGLKMLTPCTYHIDKFIE